MILWGIEGLVSNDIRNLLEDELETPVDRGPTQVRAFIEEAYYRSDNEVY